MSASDVVVDPGVARAAGRFRSGTATVVPPLLAFVGLLALWEAYVNVFDVREYVIPAPSGVAHEVVRSFDLLVTGMRVTLVEIVLGLALTIAVSIPLAVGIVYSRVLRNVLYPLLVGSQAIPRVAVAPLMLLWFGFGTLPKVLLAFSVAFFPLVINTVVGLQSVERDTMYVIRSMGARPLQSFLKVRLPAALPSIFGGLKVAVALSVIGVIVGEFVGSQSGLGYIVLVGQGTLNTRLIFASIAIMALLGIVLFYIVELIERLSIRWYFAARAVAQERGGPDE